MSLRSHSPLRSLSGLALASLLLCAPSAASADDDHKNMKVLEHTGPKLKKAMKDFSKGLGVKCTACHEKEDFDSESVVEKDKTRPFFEATVGDKDPAKREKALGELLAILKLEKARDTALVWKGVDALEKKKK